MQLSVFFTNNLVYILWRLVADYITIVVTIAWRIHLFSFRTQKLSFSAPKVLVGWLTGRIGRCHIPFNTALCGVFYCEIYIINSAILSESLACFVPNTEVKLRRAESTCRVCRRKNRLNRRQAKYLPYSDSENALGIRRVYLRACFFA